MKKHCIKSKIRKLRNNNRELYKIVSKLTGSAVDNPMPEHESDKVLADEFIEFFMTKSRQSDKL